MAISYVELGGTLFIPAIHKDLLQVVDGVKYPNLKSVVIDTEDSISDAKLPDAMKAVQETLLNFKKSSLFVFIRPRDTTIFKEILNFKNIDKVDGFILPKFSLSNAQKYLSLLENSQHSIMPSIEGSELFEESKLIELRDIVLPYKNKITLIRFGLEDMLRQLKMKRKCDESIFDFSVTNSILGNFLAIFKSSGFEISAGVYPCFKDTDGFINDVQRDLKEGLFSKTIIHPNQIEIINELYKVSQQEYDEALEISTKEKAIFNQNGKMAESSTMLPFSEFILRRAKVYGVSKKVL